MGEVGDVGDFRDIRKDGLGDVYWAWRGFEPTPRTAATTSPTSLKSTAQPTGTEKR